MVEGKCVLYLIKYPLFTTYTVCQRLVADDGGGVKDSVHQYRT